MYYRKLRNVYVAINHSHFQSMIDMLQNKLRGHFNFQMKQRLIVLLCVREDCRVVDIIDSMAQDPLKTIEILELAFETNLIRHKNRH